MKQLLVDVWEADVALDHAVLKANSVAGVIIRINDMVGGHHLDKNFLSEYAKAKASGMLFAIYFVYNPWVDSQANYLWITKNLPFDYTGRIFVDVEVSYSGYSSVTYAQQLLLFVNALMLHFPVTIYTGAWFLPNLKTWPNDYSYWWAAYPLVLYSTLPLPTTWDAVRKITDGLTQPGNAASCPGPIKLWQVSGDRLHLPGDTNPIDVSIFDGTLDDLTYWLTGVIAPPPIPPQPAPIVVNVRKVDIGGVLVPGVVTVTVDVSGGGGGLVTYVQNVDQTPVTPPPPPPVPVHNYYRVLDDIEAGRTVRNGLPSTVRFHSEIIETGKPGAGFVMLSDALMKYAVKINDNGLGALKYQFDDFKDANPHILKAAVGWHNQGAGNRVEELTFSGNIVDVTRIVGNKAYVRCIYNGETAPTEFILPPVQKFTIQYSTYLDTDGNGKQPRTFIVANPGEELWLDLADLKKV